jgi:hypothetical protein
MSPSSTPTTTMLLCVVGDGRGHRAALQTEAAHEAEADPPRRQVALDYGEFGEVARGIRDREPPRPRAI